MDVSHSARWFRQGGWLVLGLAAVLGADRPRPEDDGTFRPTVLIRQGNSQGSGTVIASAVDRTLILTAAHVVEESGPLEVELHRYNLGLERWEGGVWPRTVRAEVVAADKAADLAVIRIRGLRALPYVARLAPAGAALATGERVTSLGIDRGARLSSWMSRVERVSQFKFVGLSEERPFVITARPPEHGRSGGGLFLENGELAGVCIGRAELVAGRRSGVFASGQSIHRLLRQHHLETPSPDLANRPAANRRDPAITTTRARTAR